MHTMPALYGAIGLGMAFACAHATAQSTPELLEQLKAMRQQMEAQQARIDEFERRLAVKRAEAPSAQLEQMRGAGSVAQTSEAQGGPVGRPPQEPKSVAVVTPIFENPGVLTPAQRLTFEPRLQYSYSSSNRVALVGYTVIPALLIGLLDVREVKRNTTIANATFRYGLNNRVELEANIPYVYRTDSSISRELFTGTAVDRVFDTSGTSVGDIELAARYQLNAGGVDKPYYIVGLRYKSRTGRDPFDVVTDCQTRCVGGTVTGSGLPLKAPTGSGFTSLQPSVTWLLPSDPAVFFGGFSYTHNFSRNNLYRNVLAGQREFLGEIEAGDIFGFNVGMGLALNEKASFSIGYDHSSVGRTRQNGTVIPGSVRIQLGTLLLGASYQLSKNRTVDFSVGAGVTRDTPDVTLTVRMPFNL